MKDLLLALFDFLGESFAPPILRPFLGIIRHFIGELTLSTEADGHRAIGMIKLYIQKATALIASSDDMEVIDAGLIVLEIQLGQALKDAGLLPTG
jgi:hypothetical protein